MFNGVHLSQLRAFGRAIKRATLIDEHTLILGITLDFCLE